MKYRLRKQSFLLICSDGLSNKLSIDEMSAILTLNMTIEEKGKKLVQLANDSGGEDNISLVLLSQVMRRCNECLLEKELMIDIKYCNLLAAEECQMSI